MDQGRLPDADRVHVRAARSGPARIRAAAGADHSQLGGNAGLDHRDPGGGRGPRSAPTVICLICGGL